MRTRIVSKAKLEALGGGRFRVSGILDAKTVTAVLEQSVERFAGAPHVDVDFTGVSESDSAGLALVLEWLRAARRNQQTIHFANLPAQISALARISEVEDLLTANGTSNGTKPAVAAQA